MHRGVADVLDEAHAGSNTRRRSRRERASAHSLPGLSEVNARFTASPIVGRAPVEVHFTDRSSGAMNWSWNFGDGTNSTDINPVHIFTDKGKYSVTLVVTIGNSIESATETVWVI